MNPWVEPEPAAAVFSRSLRLLPFLGTHASSVRFLTTNFSWESARWKRAYPGCCDGGHVDA
jgi:hypothetical protein